MKLKKIKLINWHIFTDHTIEIDGNVLITGENASGKSTLMDAIYYVLSGGDQYHFNKAANEGGQRNLETYMRGKLGSEKNPFLRPQTDIVSYIVLEYEDEKRRHNMVLGCEMEIIASTQPKNHFFVINNYKIKDDDFIKDKQIVEFRSFKMNAKAMKYDFDELPDTKKERRRKLAKDIFKLDDYKRYYDLLQNAICFKPISEVSTFVNGFLLDEDNIELSNLRDEIRSYQNIHKLVIKEKEKIETLKEFIPKAEKYMKNIEDLKYFNALRVNSKIEKLNNIINCVNIDLKRLEDEYNSLKSSESSLRINHDRLKNEIYQLENNEAYKVLINKKKNCEQLKSERVDLTQRLNDFSKMVASEQSIVRALGLNYRFDDDYKKKDFGLLIAHFENYNEQLKELNEKIRREIAKIDITIEQNNNSKKGKEKELDGLNKGLNNYPADVYNLIKIAEEAIIKANPREKNPEVRPLCEYIEINDEKWSNALEGYLNTRKFNLIFDPDYYDVVSVAYDRYKNERKAYVAGIVNANIPSNKPLKNSLMTKINVKNKHANKYANYLLGDLVCVEDVKELKHFASSITPEVMVYKNYVQKATNPEIYRIPFIGRDSRRKRIEILKNDIIQIDSDNDLCQKRRMELEKELTAIKDSNIDKLLKSENYWVKIDNKQSLIKQLEDEIKSDEANNGLLEITGRIDTARNNLKVIEKNLSDNEEKKKENSFKQGEQKHRINNSKEQLQMEQNNFSNIYKFLDENIFETFKNKYTSNGRLNNEQINNDYESTQNFNNAVNASLVSTMQKYSSTYKASLTPIIENIGDYVNEYYDLINRGVVQYEMEAKEAYERAEISFREDFIAKLKEKIEKSQKMLDKINKNLALHPFGNDEEKYKFYYEPTKDSEFYNYYRIIMSSKLMESKDLFTEILDEKDYSIMKDLFGKISMETDSEQAIKEVERYLDYRNYMNYDIKITNKYGDESYFSKINREKSGGETQTPFYIVIASCFDELMNKDSNKVESTCQVVFDEAFNNMDESRIKSLMEFYKKLNIQIIIIVPSNRMSAISHYVDTLVGIIKVNNYPHLSVASKQ